MWVVVLAILGGGAWYFFSQSKTGTDLVNTLNTNPQTTVNTAVGNIVNTVADSTLLWQRGENGWQLSGGTAPECPVPLELTAPVDLTKVTAILYPGQTRGGNYKPHGGFRFDDNTTNAVAVTSPADGFVVEGSRYIEHGEVQYLFGIIDNCGIMYRFDHLLTLSPKLQAIAEQFPAAQEGDSRTTMVQPAVAITKGESIATAVGFTAGPNVSMDWGVYDLRVKNQASQDPAYAASHDAELAQHAICWLDELPAADAAMVKSLPAGDQASGTSSDYCD